MFDMETVNTYTSRGVAELMDRIDDCLARLDGGPEDDSREQFRQAYESPCTDPWIGCYVELYGIDRLASWQALTPEILAQYGPDFLMESDLPKIRQVPGHLDRCKRCLAASYCYAIFVEQHLPMVMQIASDSLNARLREEPLPVEECAECYEDLMRTAYHCIISVPRMEYRDAALDDLASVPCEKPGLSRFFRTDGITNYCELLLQSDHELRSRRSRVARLPAGKRYERLCAISDHLKECLRCSAQYDYEKREAKYQNLVFEVLEPIGKARRNGGPSCVPRLTRARAVPDSGTYGTFKTTSGGETAMNLQGNGRGDPDAELIRRIQAGDTEAFGELYERHAGLTLNLIERRIGKGEDSFDLNQELWIKVFRVIGAFEIERYQATFKTWVCVCAVNRTRDYYQSVNRREMVPLKDFDRYGDYRDDPDRIACGDQSSIAVRDDLLIEKRILLDELLPILEGSLGERDRAIWRLRELDGETYGAIAERMGMPMGSIKSRMHRMRRRILTRIESYQGSMSRA